jgi:hypothetical protein
VFQKNFNWFVNYNGSPIPFFSGMRLAWTKLMTIKYTFDIQTKQPVYAVCHNDRCIFLTTSITTAIKKVQNYAK